MDVFTLKATIDLDSTPYERGLDQAKQLAGSVFNGIKAVAKVGTAAIGLASAGVATLAKNSVDSYAEYEQMVGGVQKLYGNMGKSLEDYAKDTGRSTKEVKAEWQNLEKAQNIVLDNAKNAYKTAGISANQYMEMATSFSASLINSLGGDTVKAAEQTDVAMRAISDNFNTFGGDIGMIQNAFQGFAKQNYMMLDNLKLGYGGTKKEMQRLIDDANEYGKAMGMAGDLSIESFSDVVTAIDLIQQKQNVAGTTAREAATTIAGSWGSVKAAWKNLVTGISDPKADIGQLISNLVDTASASANNLMPTLEKALSGIGTLIERIVPIISEKLPEVVEGVLPSLLNAATSLVIGITQALPSILSVLIQQAPSIISQIATALVQAAPELLKTGEELADSLLGAFWDAVLSLKNVDFKDFGDKLGQAISDFFDSQNGALAGFAHAASRLIEYIGNGLSEAIPQLVPHINDVIVNIADFLTQEGPELINTGVNLATSLVTGLSETLPTLIPTAIDTLLTLIDDFLNGDGLDKIADAAVSLATNLATGISNAIPVIADKLPDILWKLLMGIVDNYPKFAEAAGMVLTTLGKALLDLGSKLTEKGKELGDNLFGGFIEKIQIAFTDIKNAVIDSEIYQSFAELLGSIKELLSVAWGFLTQWWSILWTFVQTEVGIMKAGLTTAFVWVKTTVETWLNAIKLPFLIMFEGIKSAALLFWDLLKNAFTTSCNVISGVIKSFLALIKGDWKGALDNMKSAAQSGLDGVKNVFRSVIDTIKNLINNVIRTAKNWGKDLIDSFVTGIKAKISSVGDAIREVANKIWDLMHFSEPEEGPLSDFHTYAPDMMKLFAKGVKDNTRLVTDQIQKSFDFSDVIAEQNVNVNQPVQETKTRTPGNVVINVYGAEGQDINALADEISYRLQHLYDVRDAVFA